MRMPLKLKLGKKSGRYDLSQDLYVLKVFLADQELLQCTLGADSTGRDCVEYISQKLEIQQVVMFGLRYQVRCSDPDKRMMRWVELDKPLRKQLEKWACKNRQVLLAVLYHTPNALALTDELARYYYFLLMRSDVVEGRLTVEMDKAIDLAAYSLQAEYGNHDPATHTIEFLQTIPLLPKHISRSAQILEDLLRRVAAYHDRLQGMQQSHASLLYIADAQQCEGYGEEFFFARDEDSTEVQIGYGQDGIVVRRTHVAPLKYRWEEIKEIHSSKRNLIIRQTEMSVFYFVMEDPEMAKYVSMVFNWQLSYFCHLSSSATDDRTIPRLSEVQNVQFHQQSHHHSSGEHEPPKKTSVPTQRTEVAVERRPHILPQATVHQPSAHQNSIYSSSIGLSGADNQQPLSSTSFRHPAAVLVTPERPRAATTSSTGMIATVAISGAPAKTTTTTPRLPPYKPAPDYDTALKQPTIEEYRMMVSARQKQLIAAQGAGSSPEIHLMGVSLAATNVVQAVNVRPTAQHALSTPDLLSKWRSTPDLISSITNNRGGLARSQASPTTRPSISATVEDFHGLPPTERSQTDIRHTTPVAVDTHVTSVIVSPASDREPLPSELTSDEDEMRPPISRNAALNGVILAKPDVLAGGDRATLSSNDETLSLLLQKLATDSFDDEFANIPMKRVSAGVSTSQKQDNLKRNRLRNILPYEDTRVMLRPHKHNPVGYINASNIQIPVGNALLKYVATQAPMRETLVDYWQMIWETGAQLIVMLCEAQDTKTSTIPVYWPTKASKGKLKVGEYSVSLVSTTTSRHQTTTILTLKFSPSGERRTVYHLQYLDWPSGGTPLRQDAFLGFLDAVSSVKRHLDNERQHEETEAARIVSNAQGQQQPQNKSRSRSTSRANLTDVTNRHRSQSMDGGSWRRRFALYTSQHAPTPSTQSDASEWSNATSTTSETPPTVVHCVSGTSETGVYILVELMIYCLEHNRNVDIPRALGMLRQQRMGLVKTVEQYKFVYSVLANYLQKSRLI